MENQQPSQSQQKGSNKSVAITIGILVGIAAILLVMNGAMKKSGGSDEPVVNGADSGFVASILDTSKWETLRIPSSSLGIKYPAEFIVTESDQGYVRFALKQNDKIEAANILAISVLSNSKMLSLDEWFLQSDEFMNKQEFDKIPKRENAGSSSMEEERRNIAGKEVVIQRDYSEGGEGLTVFVPEGNIIVKLYSFFPSSVYGSPELNKNFDIGYLDINKEAVILRYLRREVMEDILFRVAEELK